MAPAGMIIFLVTVPSRFQRLKWWMQDLPLIFRRPLTEDEWYASGCPRYRGQKRWLGG